MSTTACSRNIRIERDTTTGPGWMIGGSDICEPLPPQDRNRYDPALYRDVHIGPRVCIGTRCIVLEGAQIGNNSIVEAGSVVRDGFPPDSLIAGNPARIVRSFDQCAEMVERAL